MAENNCSWSRKLILHRDTLVAAAAIYQCKISELYYFRLQWLQSFVRVFLFTTVSYRRDQAVLLGNVVLIVRFSSLIIGISITPQQLTSCLFFFLHFDLKSSYESGNCSWEYCAGSEIFIAHHRIQAVLLGNIVLDMRFSSQILTIRQSYLGIFY